MARRGFRTKNAQQIRRKWFQMKSAYHCHKKGNNDRLLLIPEEFRNDIRDFVESESKGFWKNRNEPSEQPGICDWFNPNVTTNGDADDEGEASMADDCGQDDSQKYIPPPTFDLPSDIEIKPEPLDYTEMCEDQQQENDDEELEPTLASSSQRTQQITFPMDSVPTEFKKNKRKQRNIIYEQTPDVMQDMNEEDQEGSKHLFSFLNELFCKFFRLSSEKDFETKNIYIQSEITKN